MKNKSIATSNEGGAASPDLSEETVSDNGLPDTMASVEAPSDEATPDAAPPDESVPDGPIDVDLAQHFQENDDPSIDPGTLEALLFSTHHPLTAARLAELLKLGSTKPLRPSIRALNDHYTSTGRSFRIEQVAGGYQLLTLPVYGPVVKLLHQKEIDAKLTKAALETLAIIAYKQPILRADIEAIRGVACGETIRSLMEKHLVKIDGRAEEPGRPILYGTTRRFLEVFGLNTVKDLPQADGGVTKD